MNRLLTTFIAFAILCVTATAQDPDWHKPPKETGPVLSADEQAHLDIIVQPGDDIETLKKKMFSYKWLGTRGTARAAAVLVTRFDVDKEGFYARYAAETIPGDEVDVALCTAIKDLKDPTAIAGTLTTLGVRAGYFGIGSTSVATAKEYLGHEDADVRKAAAYAFACCGGDDAVEYFTNKDIDVLQADSGFLLAELFAAKGEKDKAAKIYDALAEANIPAYQKRAAVLWSIVTKGGNAIPVLVEQLASEDAKLFAVGLKAGRELPAGTGACQAMVEQLGKQADPYRQSLLVRAIGDRKDAESKTLALPILTKLAGQGGDQRVRLAAIQSLKNMGDASSLPPLIEAANETMEVTKDGKPEIVPTPIAVAANATLADLPGKEVDDAIVAMYEKGDSNTKISAIKLIEQRRIASAFPLLKQGLKDESGVVRKAALNALGQNATFGDFPELLVMLVDVEEDDAEEILVVLKSAGTRMPQGDVADEIDKLFEKGSTELRVNLLELLKEIGGPKAMNIVEQAAWGEDDTLKDKATAILGAWPPGKTEDLELLAAACKKVAVEATGGKYKRRGLRGYIRLARQFNMPEEQRLTIARDAMSLATQKEDKELVLDAYGRWPSLKTLQAVVPFIDNADLQKKACEEAVKICEKLQGKDAKIVEAMKKVSETTADNALKDRAKRVLDKQ